MLTYNSKMTHSAHGMTPNKPHKDSSHMEVKIKLEMNRVKTRKYPPVRVGDEVKIYRKKKGFPRKNAHPIGAVSNTRFQQLINCGRLWSYWMPGTWSPKLFPYSMVWVEEHRTKRHNLAVVLLKSCTAKWVILPRV